MYIYIVDTEHKGLTMYKVEVERKIPGGYILVPGVYQNIVVSGCASFERYAYHFRDGRLFYFDTAQEALDYLRKEAKQRVRLASNELVMAKDALAYLERFRLLEDEQ